MKEILKKDWPYLFLIIGLIVLSAMATGLFRFGFFTAYDEAYMLLKLQEAYDMSCITGKSQWNLIAVHWFPFMDLTSKVNSYLASAILHWISIIVMTITACIIYDKKRVLKYLGLIFLVYFTTGGGLSYVPMQTAVLCWAFCAFMLFQYSKKTWVKCVHAMLCGIFLGFACFIIIPAALILLALIAALILYLYWDNIKDALSYIGCGVLGVLITIAYMHFVVCDIREIVDAMLFTASYIGKSGYHYDGASFVMQFGLFFRDCIFVLLTFVGAYWLSSLTKNKYIGAIIYVGLLLIYTHYQVKPQITPSMFLASVVLIPFLFTNRSKVTLETLKNRDTYLYLFMFLFPLIASLGTNTALGGRMTAFVVSWLFLLFNQEQKHPNEDWRRVLIGVIILFLIPICGIPQKYLSRDDSHHFTRGNQYFSEIALTEKQEDYFNQVYDILEEYNYQPKQSAVLTACYDYCCLYAFDAVNAANYHQVQNFHYFPKENMIEPDFIFLCKWDSIVMAKELQEQPWGWPEEFDEYFVGTPEPEDAPWVGHPELEARKLYCRKSLKTND